MKEDILEQIAEDYFNLQPGMFTKHNVRYLPDKKRKDYDRQTDCVHSDIDIIAVNLKKATVIVVNCKSWQTGFNTNRWAQVIEKAIERNANKVAGKREAWERFRELVSPKWTDGFRRVINTTIGKPAENELAIEYWILCTKVNKSADSNLLENSNAIKDHLKKSKLDISITVKPVGELIEDVLNHLNDKETTSVETTHFSRTLQILKASGYKFSSGRS